MAHKNIFTQLATFDLYHRAHLCKTNLEAAGIPCFLFDEITVSNNIMNSNAFGGIKLNVRSQDVAEARKILKSIEDTPYTTEDGETIACPKCGSTHLDNSIRSIKDFKSLVFFILAFLTFTYPLHHQDKYLCKDCKTIF